MGGRRVSMNDTCVSLEDHYPGCCYMVERPNASKARSSLQQCIFLQGIILQQDHSNQILKDKVFAVRSHNYQLENAEPQDGKCFCNEKINESWQG
jgi:hypothetical protein